LDSEAVGPLRRRRGAFDIISEIIANIPDGGIRKTLLANKCSLDYRVFEKYLSTMLDAGLVELDEETGKVRATERGLRFYQQWTALRETLRKNGVPY